MKFLIERCKHWNGREFVCDPSRECCVKRITRLVSKGFESCQNKPFENVKNDKKMSPTDVVRFLTDPNPRVGDEPW